MEFINTLYKNFNTLQGSFSFCINEQNFLYSQQKQVIAAIQTLLQQHNQPQKPFAIVGTNHIATYSSLMAGWFLNMPYVPLGLNNPVDRNLSILKDACVSVILTTISLNKNDYEGYTIIDIANVANDAELLVKNDITEDDVAYILFTSGSTGKPKGVPISYGNLQSFINSFFKTELTINASDKCLQMFDLTFDVSVSSYLPALLQAAQVYTVQDDGIKYVQVLKLLHQHPISFVQIVPSVIKLGKPLLQQLTLPHIKHCILTGEATQVELLEPLKIAMPNAAVYNYYGPTECTIYCTYYSCNTGKIKSYNGMLAIGKTFFSTQAVVVNSNLNPALPNEKGELLLASNQLTKGYINYEDKNARSFITLTRNNVSTIWYKTGDICFKDDDGDIFYCGRLDNQVKINGCRIELSEIEFLVSSNFNYSSVAIVVNNKQAQQELVLVIESDNSTNKSAIQNLLKQKLPAYMLPKQIYFMPQLPVGSSFKLDRQKTKTIIQQLISE